MSSSYRSVYQSWQSDPEGFWAKAANDVQWSQPWTSVLDATRPPFCRWFAGGELNTCHNALDHHVDDEPAAVALAQAVVHVDAVRLAADDSSAYRDVAPLLDALAQAKYNKAGALLTHAFEVEPNSRSGREALLLAADAYFLHGGSDDYIKCEAKYRDFLNRFP